MTDNERIAENSGLVQMQDAIHSLPLEKVRPFVSDEHWNDYVLWRAERDQRMAECSAAS
jgi:hypothetical protein